MKGELARKRPAIMVAKVAGVDLPRHEVIQRRTKDEALSLVERMARNGEIGGAFTLAETDQGYAVKVMRIREPRRGGFRWVLLLAFTASATLAVLALWLLVKALAPLLPVLAIGLVVWLLLAKTGRGHSTVTVTQNVRMRHHH